MIFAISHSSTARQLQIERVTLGALKAEPGCLDRVLGFKQVAI
jgi:hypothetical protein